SKFYCLLWIVCAFPFMTWAQNLEVTGRVTDGGNGKPLVGVSVIVQGSTTGTVTNEQGRYTIAAPQGASLVFSYVGMETLERTVSGNVLNVTMMSSNVLDEVVAIGYGTVRKGDVSGSSVTLGEDA